MLTSFRPLKPALMPPETRFAEPTQAMPEKVTLEDPAVSVMTDFEKVSAVLVRPGDSLDEANRRMIQRRVRMLLVVDENRNVAGLITASDILGEKPLQIISARGGHRDDIAVRDIMAPPARLEALRLSDVAAARVGHIVTTLRDAGRQHALVVDSDADGRARVRGVFSLTQIARQLGLAVQASEIARTFSEIEAQLVH